MEKVLNALKEAAKFSDNVIHQLRTKIAEEIRNDSLAICVVGSFGRREASKQSDLDYFVLGNGNEEDFVNEIGVLKRLIAAEGIKMPSKDGAFDSYVSSCDEMSRNIGGLADTTQKLTRRLLFLLEGNWLYNQTFFDRCLEVLIQHYVRDTITEHQLCRFLLNDLIRYYRTICVDFECKTHQDGKTWGDRNIKIQFSRKLLYFSGILVVAETWQHNPETKREILAEYLRKTPIERVQGICGSQADIALTMYDRFLEKMSQSDVRTMLEATTDDRRLHSAEFRKFKNEGHHFTMELSRLLTTKYDQAHPIHLALKF